MRRVLFMCLLLGSIQELLSAQTAQPLFLHHETSDVVSELSPELQELERESLESGAVLRRSYVSIHREPLEEIALSGEPGMLAVNLFPDTVIEFQVFYEERFGGGFWRTKTGALPSFIIGGPPLEPQEARPPLWDEGEYRYLLSIQTLGSDFNGLYRMRPIEGKLDLYAVEKLDPAASRFRDETPTPPPGWEPPKAAFSAEPVPAFDRVQPP